MPVGNQPIAPNDRIWRIDPVWVHNPVPMGFWEEPENRRNYLLWLGHKLRYRRMRDWYRLKHEDMARNSGGTVANLYWRGSPIRAVMECFPDYEWQEWFFTQVPATFWRHRKNRLRYLAWLGEQLGFRQMEDWYRASTRDFSRHRGGSLLLEFRSSVSDTVMACFPKYPWKEWLFARMPTGFWNKRESCRRYMKWLGQRLGFQCLDDWYGVTRKNFRENSGGMLLRRYRDSVAATVIDLIPRRQWCEWKFTRVPPGFWDHLENRRRYVLWLGKQLGFRCAADWSQVRKRHFDEHCGGSLVGMYHSMGDLLEECFPDWDWNPHQRRRHRKPPLTIAQILAWADAYHAVHGKWPSQGSGRIDGANETWGGVNRALGDGLRGLEGGTSLPRLLNEHRGTRRRDALPPLSEQQIIDWAKAHFQETGHWPSPKSGKAADSNGETWRTIERALANGTRGLQGGTTLTKLLRQHGLQ